MMVVFVRHFGGPFPNALQKLSAHTGISIVYQDRKVIELRWVVEEVLYIDRVRVPVALSYFSFSFLPIRISMMNALCFQIPTCRMEVKERKAAILFLLFGFTKGSKIALPSIWLKCNNESPPLSHSMVTTSQASLCTSLSGSITAARTQFTTRSMY